MRTILAADIGGTSSRFALYRAGKAGMERLARVDLATGEYASFRELLAALGRRMDGEGPAPECAVLAVPGAVFEGRRCDPPNIAWDMDLERDWPAALYGLTFGRDRLFMINDFEAQAYALRTPCMARAVTVQAGRERPERTQAVIGAGTGLGHCALVRHAGGWLAVPSEAGHGAFPFVGAAEHDLERFILDRLGLEYCWLEHVVSGSGLARVHEFLSGERLEPEQVAGRLDAHPRTVRWFARFYGRAARQFVMQVLAVGGLCVSGGVAVKNPCLVLDPAFLEEFRSCPKYERMLAEVPLRLLSDPDSGLLGAAFLGLQESERPGGGSA